MADRQSGTNTLWEGVLSAIRSPSGARPPEPFSEMLQRVVSRHIAQEESSIERYQQLRKQSKDPVVRMLIGELLGDEVQHHGMLRRMEAQLLAELGETPGTPDAGSGEMSESERQELAETMEKLADHEADGAKHLHDIADEARDAGSDVLGLLLDAIAMDSEKHERILKFITKRVADA